ncbi:MAG: hypothetical protein PCFJNLEI_01935 [Verrucomicrobiae bacterium]|nr:hypothetical protein [Verrucomicrobiae bacterium]
MEAGISVGLDSMQFESRLLVAHVPVLLYFWQLSLVAPLASLSEGNA